jgi:hypothetical protein
MNIMQRLQSPTPSFFKKIRKIGLILAAISGAVLTAPIALPAAVVTAATYLGLAGTVATVVSQTATGEDQKAKEEKNGTEPSF